MITRQRAIQSTKLILILSVLSFWFVLVNSGPTITGGLLVYEVGTANVGLASADYDKMISAQNRILQTLRKEITDTIKANR